MTQGQKRIQAKADREKLIDFLGANGLSAFEFAEVVGVTKSAVKHWVNGIRDIPQVYMRVLRMVEADKLDLWEFMRA